MEPFSLPSFAKINLHLRVLGRRPDGYHDLLTVFQTVSLHDTLKFEENDDLVLECDIPTLAVGDENIIVRAAHALQKHTGTKKGARMGLRKKIPSPGGLGGGSSNAAAALIGLSRLWSVHPGSSALRDIAAGLGADVPFFLHGGTVLGKGKGDELSRVRDFRAEHILIVTPPIDVSTAEAYETLDSQGLTSNRSNLTLNVCRNDAAVIDLTSTSFENDFENVIFDGYPEIARVKSRLFNLGARQALMCGSGASVFGIFEKEETRQAAIKALDNEVNWRKFAVATISRDEYRDALRIA